jgi:hypothetical protein
LRIGGPFELQGGEGQEGRQGLGPLLPDKSSGLTLPWSQTNGGFSMDDELQRDLGRSTSHYPLLSGLLLLSIPVACLIGYLIFGDYAWLNAVALLLVPSAVFSWMFTTIKGIHLVGVRFWFIPSTYVTLFGGIIALIICMVMGLLSHEATHRGNQVTDSTLYAAAAILYGGCVVWSHFYNWRRTSSAILALSLTMLQTISAALVIGVINLWLDRSNMKRYEREHGID